ncbi:peptidase M48-like protein [Geothermobacter ehrlichii]|uniref:Peptidase M48-like protein n=1 Tax=Geothermobacter ehrlichii TaxID=213224 RepID=A0A5D3WLM5_9BACT|nr:M48 family metallopeptidase [Geothermobacter ehrlichii]TYO98907.1 peptidase M48-like protein [Geothermobacter ehrlichii]
MKFTPRLPAENVNVSKTHPLVEFAWLVGGLVLLCLLVFGGLGLAVDLVVDHVSLPVQKQLGDMVLKRMPTKDEAALQKRLDALLAALPADSPLRRQSFRVLLAEIPEVNAVALPGNTIVVFAGLLREVTSENELAMVLAHELGHFAHRDHLRRLGRGLAVTVLAVMLFGENSDITDLVSSLFLPWQAGYSRRQESAADRFALELLVARYGHAAGATDLFARLVRQGGRRPPRLLASHPWPEQRIGQIEVWIATEQLPTGFRQPLGADLRRLAAAVSLEPESVSSSLADGTRH